MQQTHFNHYSPITAHARPQTSYLGTDKYYPIFYITLSCSAEIWAGNNQNNHFANFVIVLIKKTMRDHGGLF